MKLQVKVLSSKMFSYNAHNKEFVGEMSEIGGFDMLYDDACDLGFAIRSEKTGQIAVYCLYSSSQNKENDTIKWLFVPTTETMKRIPALRGVNVVVFND